MHFRKIFGTGLRSEPGSFYINRYSIGIITLTRRSHLCLLFVEKACHRQGIARALFSALRDHCRTAPDTPRITVNAPPYAVEADRRLGFRATGSERTVDGIRFTPMEYLFI